MAHRRTNAIQRSFAIIVLGVIAASCESDYKNEVHPYLKMGSDKEAVIDQLRESGEVSNVRPEVANKIRATSVGPMLDKVLEENGIVLNGPKFYLKISFENDLVQSVFSPPYTTYDRVDISVGQIRSSTRKSILYLFRDGVIQDVYNFLPNSRWISLATISPADKEYLRRYDDWMFHEIGTHSATKLRFESGQLVSIDRKWSPIELP